MTQLPSRRFGDNLVRYYQSADGSVRARTPGDVADRRSFAIDFYDQTRKTFDPRTVADIAVVDKAAQLKAVVDEIKRSTGAEKVILVSHSMGGLVGRAYIQGWSLNPSGRLIPYGDDVAGLVTINTPHLGSELADWALDFWGAECARAATINKAELSPSSALLATLNHRNWPANTRLDAVVSYYTSGLFEGGDGVVSRISQDVRTFSDYWATHPDVRAHLQSFLSPFVPKVTGEILHTAVLGTHAASTASRVQTIIEGIDRESVAAPALNLSGLWSGRWSSTDGQGEIALRLTQTGSTLAGPIALSAQSSTLDGTFRGTITATGPSTAALSWSIGYRQAGSACEGTFGGMAIATATTIQGTYNGADCQHSFSNGNLTVNIAPSASPPELATRRLFASQSSLYSSDLAATGVDKFIGDFKLADGARIAVTDIATTPGGGAYALSFTTLYSLDSASARVTPIGPGMLRSINALTSDSSGTLWGASLDGSLYRINPSNGEPALARQFGSGWSSSGDLAFDSGGRLFATVRRSADTTDSLISVNPTTGELTLVATNLPAGVYGLTFADGTLYGLSAATNSLYRINTSSGRITLVRRLSFSPSGAARKRP